MVHKREFLHCYYKIPSRFPENDVDGTTQICRLPITSVPFIGIVTFDQKIKFVG